MVKGNWQRRVETAVERRKLQKNKKTRKEQRAHFKALVQNQLWPLLDQINNANASTERQPVTKIHLWVDSAPSSRKNSIEMDDVEELVASPRQKGKKISKHNNKSSNAKGEESPSMKKVHPRSHEKNTEDQAAEEDAPLLCHQFFFKGSCKGLVLANGKSSSNKKNCFRCNFEHYTSKKELTLATAMKSKDSDKYSLLATDNKMNEDDCIRETLDRSSRAALVMQKVLEGEDVNDDVVVSFVDEISGIDMLYHMEIPLHFTGMDDSKLSDQVIQYLSRENVVVSSIAYVVYDNELVFDRCDNGIVLSAKGCDRLLGKVIKEIPPNTTAGKMEMDNLSSLPIMLLEYLLTFLPSAYSGILPCVNKILHQEIGTRSPSLWKQLLLREGWPEPIPFDNNNDTTLCYKEAFISHFRLMQYVDALKDGLARLLHEEGSVPLRKSIALTSRNHDFGYQGSSSLGNLCSETITCMLSDTCIIVASKRDCRFHLFDVSSQDTMCEWRLREIINVRMAPVPLSKKNSCTLTRVVVKDGFIICSFCVDGISMLTSITVDEFLSNSTEDNITSQDFLTVYNPTLLFKDFCDENRQDPKLASTIHLIEAGANFGSLDVDVFSICPSGPTFFCALAKLSLVEDHGTETMEICTGILSLCLINCDQPIVDFIPLPNEMSRHSNLVICTNHGCKSRSDPIEIACKIPVNNRIFVTAASKEGRFHSERLFLLDSTMSAHLTEVATLPEHAMHTVWTRSGIISTSKVEGNIMLSQVVENQESIHYIEGKFDALVSLSHLGEDHLLLSAWSSNVEFHIHGLRNSITTLHDALHYFHFIVMHLPDMSVIYHSVLDVQNHNSRPDVMIGDTKGLSIPLVVNATGICLLSPCLASTDKSSTWEKTRSKLKTSSKKKKYHSAAGGKKDGFARGMSLRG